MFKIIVSPPTPKDESGDADALSLSSRESSVPERDATDASGSDSDSDRDSDSVYATTWSACAGDGRSPLSEPVCHCHSSPSTSPSDSPPHLPLHPSRASRVRSLRPLSLLSTSTVTSTAAHTHTHSPNTTSSATTSSSSSAADLRIPSAAMSAPDRSTRSCLRERRSHRQRPSPPRQTHRTRAARDGALRRPRSVADSAASDSVSPVSRDLVDRIQRSLRPANNPLCGMPRPSSLPLSLPHGPVRTPIFRSLNVDPNGYLLPPVANADLPRTLCRGDSFWVGDRARPRPPKDDISWEDVVDAVLVTASALHLRVERHPPPQADRPLRSHAPNVHAAESTQRRSAEVDVFASASTGVRCAGPPPPGPGGRVPSAGAAAGALDTRASITDSASSDGSNSSAMMQPSVSHDSGQPRERHLVLLVDPAADDDSP